MASYRVSRQWGGRFVYLQRFATNTRRARPFWTLRAEDGKAFPSLRAAEAARDMMRRGRDTMKRKLTDRDHARLKRAARIWAKIVRKDRSRVYVDSEGRKYQGGRYATV